MRIRLPFAGIFFLLLLIAGYAGLSSLQLGGIVNDKVLHFVTFFLLTVAFYWVIDTSRRRTLHMALVVCTGGLGVGSEVVQALLPSNGRVFDLMDIVANIVGSLAGLGLCSWYHKRMLERRRQRRYTAVGNGEGDDDDDAHDDTAVDVELGTRSAAPPETTTTPAVATTAPVAPAAPAAAPTAGAAAVRSASLPSPHEPTPAPVMATSRPTLEEEIDNWDENAEDPWDDGDDDADLGAAAPSRTPPKKRKD